MFWDDKISQKNIAHREKFSGKFKKDPIIHTPYLIPRRKNFSAFGGRMGSSHGPTLNAMKLSVLTCD